MNIELFDTIIRFSVLLPASITVGIGAIYLFIRSTIDIADSIVDLKSLLVGLFALAMLLLVFVGFEIFIIRGIKEVCF